MPLMNVLVTLVVIGVLLWLINTYVPMQARIKQILNVVAVVATVVWVLGAFGVLGSLNNVRIGRG